MTRGSRPTPSSARRWSLTWSGARAWRSTTHSPAQRSSSMPRCRAGAGARRRRSIPTRIEPRGVVASSRALIEPRARDAVGSAAPGDALVTQAPRERDFPALRAFSVLAGRLEHARQALQRGRRQKRGAPLAPELALADVGVAIAI